jgi:hypothetical protein
MMFSYGAAYSEVLVPTKPKTVPHSFKRIGYKRWLVYEVGSGRQVGVATSRLKAYYVATVLSGIDTRNYFYFGGV